MCIFIKSPPEVSADDRHVLTDHVSKGGVDGRMQRRLSVRFGFAENSNCGGGHAKDHVFYQGPNG